MKSTLLIACVVLLVGAPVASAQEQRPTFAQAAASVQQQLQDSLRELAALRQQMAAEKIPLSQQLSSLEGELSQVRQEYQQKTRLVDSRALDLSNLRSEVKSRQDERTYLANLLHEYVRNFESRLHIAELQHYAQPLQQAKLAPENSNLTEAQVFAAQAALLSVSLDRLQDALGGTKFDGTAVDASGKLQHGSFVLVGPAAIFRPADGGATGTAEQRLGSLEPAVLAFDKPEDRAAADALAASGAGSFPLDPTLGNAHKIEATKESIVDHVKKGGPVMVPIFVLAGLALLVALYKWLSLAFVRSPKPRAVQALLAAVANRDKAAAAREAAAIGGPGGKMLQAGVEHLEEPRELIEEVMFETVMATRLRLQRLLPFIAITASSAPLLGLLGTVTGIMNTFSLMTLFGTGDVKTLSSGISEALITTEYGLYVAIPSLLLHAFLSRKAKGVIDQMEKAAVALVNQVGKTPYLRTAAPGRIDDPPAMPPRPPAPETKAAPSAEQLRELLAGLLAPAIAKQLDGESRSRAS